MRQCLRKIQKQQCTGSRSCQRKDPGHPRSCRRYHPQRKRRISSGGLTGSQCCRQKKADTVPDPLCCPPPIQRNLTLFHSRFLLYPLFSSSLQQASQKSRRILGRGTASRIFRLQSLVKFDKLPLIEHFYKEVRLCASVTLNSLPGLRWPPWQA